MTTAALICPGFSLEAGREEAGQRRRPSPLVTTSIGASGPPQSFQFIEMAGVDIDNLGVGESPSMGLATFTMS